MKYALRILALGKCPEIQISQERYDALKESRERLARAMKFEQAYEILVQNYFDVEQEILTITLRNAIYSAYDYGDFLIIRLSLNRKFINFFTTARLYLDHLKQNVPKSVSAESNIVEKIHGVTSKEYDDHFEYRFFEALRNHAQHADMSVHGFTLGSRWTTDDENGLLEFTVDLQAEKSELIENRKFKRSVLNEMPDRVNLKPALRVYMESLSRIHCAVREAARPYVDAARQTASQTIEEYQKSWSGGITGLYALMLNEQNVVIDKIPMILHWDDLRIELVKKNKVLVNLHRRNVSGVSKP
ncbi:MAG: hypothetical protein KDA64_09990 [Rhodospirillaceae bacterium]|nr:hypothetical protein [Rhodospirillaceae bacterium]